MSAAAHPVPDHIMQVGMGFWASKTLLSAVEMGVFTELANGPEEFSDLSGRLGLHPRAARDFLDALVALGFLQRSQNHYCNAPDADLFLDRNKPAYIGGMLEMANARLYGFWNHLTEALRTGQPQNEAKNGDRRFAVHGSVCGSRAAQGISRSDVRHQPRRKSRDRSQGAVGEVPDLRRCGNRTGRSGRPDRACQSASSRHGI